MALLIVSLHGLLSYMITCIGKYNSKKQDRILNTVIIYFMHQEATGYNNLKSLKCFSFILDRFSKGLLVVTLLVCLLKGHLEK